MFALKKIADIKACAELVDLIDYLQRQKIQKSEL
jgi:hypothetical protein